jgi:transcriptional regulator with PAS, ATPase and Fis domain
MVTHNAKMLEILDLVPAIADSISSVLINGDTGTGKEVLAKAIHQTGPRADKPFIAVNCGALPDALLESELFGYKAGAFTGANYDREGRIHAAEGGTLFLDEIGDVSPAFQVKLLRFLQERTYEPLGSNHPQTANVRVIAATHRDLVSELDTGNFRRDLFYRINVVRIDIPPLCDRRDDIPLLVDRFIETFNVRTGKRIRCVSDKVMSQFLAHQWPGNVSELENAIEYAFVTCADDVIDIEHVPPEIGQTHTVSSTVREGGFDHAERLVIETALRQHDYNRREAAQQLGVHPTTLFRKIKRLGISLPKRDGRNRSETT